MSDRAMDPGSAPPTRNSRELVRVVAAIVVVVVLVAFVLDNRRTVPIDFLITSAHVPLIWVLLITALLGALADRLLVFVRRRRRTVRRR